MYIWRIPIDAFAALVVGVGLALVWSAASTRRRFPSPIDRRLLLATAVLATLLSPAAVELITRPTHDRLASHGMYVDLSFVVLYGPAVAVAVLFAIGRFAFPGGRGRLAFAFVAFGFALVNVMNWCSPGWCESFGFPFAYSWRSDAILIFNGENLSAGFSIPALWKNVGLFFLATAVMSFVYRRARPGITIPS
ncbi:MAG: hypothetical protein JOZ54_01355 [Acidobacteria bacterium]|nr:hypothetical protein [Acidobacteriota bacterium]